MSDPITMEEDDFDKYEIDEVFKKHFFDGKLSPRDRASADEDLRIWLSGLLEDKDVEHHKDVTFVVGDGDNQHFVKAHRLVLITRSREFADILDKHPDSHTPVEITEMDPEVFKMMIHFVYTGQIPTPRKILATVRLMYAAKKYGIQPLYNLMKLFLERRLPKVRIKHCIMITQSVLDYELKELEDDCLKIMEDNTDKMVNENYFLRVSELFIRKLLNLDSFHGIGEAKVFNRVLEWAMLRKGDKKANDNLDEFAMSRPEVRQAMEGFIHDFRLVSIEKDDLAALLKESGVFTEHEQLTVCYYLLEQKKNLGEFTMKSRGRNGRKSKSEDKPEKSIQKTIVTAKSPDSPPKPPVYEPIRVLTPVALHNFEEHPPPPQKAEKLSPSILYPSLKTESLTEKNDPSKNHKSSQKQAIPVARAESKEHKPPTKDIQHQNYHHQSPTLVDKIRMKFGGVEKKKLNGKEKTTGKSANKTTDSKLIRTSSVNVDEKRPRSSSSSSSSDSSRSTSPTTLNRASTQPDLSKSTNNLDESGVQRRSRGTLTERPRSVLVDGDTPPESFVSSSVGKKNTMKNGFGGVFNKKTWSPENGRLRSNADQHHPKPLPPPRVKSNSNVSSNSDIVAEI